MKKILITSGIIAAVLLLLLFSKNPTAAISWFLFSPFKGTLFLGSFLSRLTLLLICGSAGWLSISAGKINLGGEGNVAIGGISALAIMVVFKESSPILILPLSLISAALGGWITSTLSTTLYSKLKIDTLITSFLISLMAVYLVNTLISTLLSSPDSYLITTVPIDPKFRINSILPPSKATLFIIPSLLLVPAISLFWNRTLIGYEMKMTGLNPHFATYGGINSIRRATQAFKASGILYSIAGALAVTTIHYSAPHNFQAGWGWQGITIALIAGKKSSMLLPAAILISWIAEGATYTSLLAGTSLELNGIIEGLLILFITSKIFAGKKNDL